MRAEQKFSLDPGGTFVLDNPVGDIEIIGADVTEIEATIITTITAAERSGVPGRPAAFRAAHRRRRRRRASCGRRRRADLPADAVDASRHAGRIRVPRSRQRSRHLLLQRRASASPTSLGNVTVNNFNGNLILTNSRRGHGARA